MNKSQTGIGQFWNRFLILFMILTLKRVPPVHVKATIGYTSRFDLFPGALNQNCVKGRLQLSTVGLECLRLNAFICLFRY